MPESMEKKLIIKMNQIKFVCRGCGCINEEDDIGDSKLELECEYCGYVQGIERRKIN